MTKRKIILLIVAVLILLSIVGIFSKASFVFSKIIEVKNIAWEKIFGKEPLLEYTPLKDEDRINVLLLGIGGIEHEEGRLLTDSIMIVSFKKSTGQIAFISIPRDLYIQMPGEKYKEKINTSYALGLQKYQNGLDYSRKVIGYVTGIYIDYVAAVDFDAFKSVIDALNGITIFLDEPFIEDKQWWCDENGMNCKPFIVEAGEQILDGETALFYDRSRYSSTDFDRAHRQQQVMVAIKNKALSLGILANPLKVNNLFDIVSDNVRINIRPVEIPGLVKLAQKADMTNVIKRVFDISPEGLLYETEEDGIYILLPVGDNFDKIRETCQNIF